MSALSKHHKRILAFCDRNHDAQIVPLDGDAEHCLLTKAGDTTGPRLLAQKAAVSFLEKQDLLRREQQRLRLTRTGTAALCRATSAKGDAFLQQHRLVANETMRTESGWETVKVNRNESPLSRLRARSAADGRQWVSDAGFEAGERLRRDFEFGNLRQSVSSNWNFGGSSGSSASGAKADLSDNALDARRRLERAVAFLGPDLSGVVLDVCCFLKGLENVERDRRWPPRSAKLMLRTALDLLATHYGTRAGSRPTG